VHILILLPLVVRGQQNLVPNGSFEEMTSCPTGSAQIELAMPWMNDIGGCDLYTPCSTVPIQGVPENVIGHQLAHSGFAYAGIFTFGGPLEPNGREYLQVPLIAPLQAGGYVISFRASLADDMKYAVGSLGAYLSDTIITREQFNSVLEVEPSIQSPAGIIMSDKDIWYHITDTFASRYGGERYLLIGNFKSTAESDTLLVPTGANNGFKSYYYIDDVSVLAIDSITGINDELGTRNNQLSVYPNPNNGQMTVEYELKEEDSGKLFFYNTIGQCVLSSPLNKGLNLMSVNLNGVSSGLYSVVAVVNGEVTLSEKISILRL
jgi:hypothetical protein